jgi:hypothetical protein
MKKEVIFIYTETIDKQNKKLFIQPKTKKFDDLSSIQVHGFESSGKYLIYNDAIQKERY